VKTPPFIRRLGQNLDSATLPELLRYSAVVMENAREFFTKLDRTGDIDALYKPFIRELLRRSFEAEPAPPRVQYYPPPRRRGTPRGNA
jgi:hypothetical protein